MVELRYYVSRNRMPTAHDVAVYRAEHNISIMDAKAALLNESKPRLQYRNRDGAGRWSDWKDVPTEIEVFG